MRWKYSAVRISAAELDPPMCPPPPARTARQILRRTCRAWDSSRFTSASRVSLMACARGCAPPASPERLFLWGDGSGNGCWVLGAGGWVLGAGWWGLGAGCWVLGAGWYKLEDFVRIGSCPC